MNFPYIVAGAYSFLFKTQRMLLYSSLLFTSACISESVNLRESLVLFCSSHEGLYLTCWKQLRTLGSMLLPPKAATSPSCRGIWIASWSRRPSCLWSHISVGPATSLKRSATSTKDTILFHFHVHLLLFSNAAAQALNFCIIIMVTNGHCPKTFLWSWFIAIQMRKIRPKKWRYMVSYGT